jgi:rsbT co-antagonist protein RsbR
MMSRETELSVLYEISSLTSSVGNVESLLDIALDKITRFLGADLAIFYVIQADQQQLQARATRGVRLKRVCEHLPVAAIAQLGNGIRCWHGTACPLDPLRGAVVAPSSAGLAISIDQQVIGWIFALWMRPYQITPVEETLCSVLADRVAGAFSMIFARERESQQREALIAANQQLQQLVAESNAAQQQQAALLETIQAMSVPVLQLSEHALLMPLIGNIDSVRSQMITERMLLAISHYAAQLCIIDITGVPFVDTQVANILIKAAEAARLLGARIILCGISPEVAQVIVSLGVHLHTITTMNNLRSALKIGLAAKS